MWGFWGIAPLTCDLITDGGEWSSPVDWRLGGPLWWSWHCVEEKNCLPVPGINL